MTGPPCLPAWSHPGTHAAVSLRAPGRQCHRRGPAAASLVGDLEGKSLLVLWLWRFRGTTLKALTAAKSGGL